MCNVVDDGIHMLGRLVVFSDGRLRVDSGNGTAMNFGSFNAKPLGNDITSPNSGWLSLTGSYHAASSTY
jgi:hypothetical protein